MYVKAEVLSADIQSYRTRAGRDVTTTRLVLLDREAAPLEDTFLLDIKQGESVPKIGSIIRVGVRRIVGFGGKLLFSGSVSVDGGVGAVGSARRES